MKKILNILLYYILIIIGLIGTSWIIWSRFIRERTIRYIPDALLTEYRFWILLYICGIYLYVVKNLIKETKPNIMFNVISEVINRYLWKPLTTLDHAIKYNSYCRDKYHKFIIDSMISWDIFLVKWHPYYIIFAFQIIPRMILAILLLLDTFYFNKLETFYKFVLIGLLPFIFRYIKYCVTDFYDYLVKQLTDFYDEVQIFEKGYYNDISRRHTTKAVWHLKFVTVEDYIDIMHETILDGMNHTYVGHPYCKEEISKQYEKQFNKPISTWTGENHGEVIALFHDLMPQIINLKITIDIFQLNQKKQIIIWSKVGVFSIYLICWSYVLMTSYYNYPIELPMFKYLMKNMMQYLTIGDDPFINNVYSINRNLITMKSIKNLLLNIISNIIK